MTEKPTIKVINHGITVRVIDGKPQCPMHGHSMVEVEGERWACPDWAEFAVALDRYLQEAARRILRESSVIPDTFKPTVEE